MSEPTDKVAILEKITALLKENGIDNAPFLPELIIKKEMENLEDYIESYKNEHIPLEEAFEKENGCRVTKCLFDDSFAENPLYILMDKYAYEKLIWEYTARILYRLLTKKE